MSQLTRPPERFYWCVLDAPGWRRSGALPPGLLAQLEEELAVPDLHAVGTPLAEGRLLVCALPRGELAGLDALSLRPCAVPDFAPGADPGPLNLLVGRYEPARLRRARRRAHARAATTVALCALLLALGLLRRAAAAEALARADQARADAVVRAAVGGGDRVGDLVGDLQRTLSAARAAPPRVSIPDAAVALAAVLEGWPARVPAQAQSLAVGPGGAAVSVALEGDPAAFLTALRLPAGWSLQEPRLNSAGGVTRLSLRLARGDAP